MKKKDLPHLTGTCDVAILVKEAAWDRGKARFQLVEIGTPELPGRPPGVCHSVYGYDQGTLEISGFAADEKPEALTAAVGQVLQTPEQYLAARGVPFNIPPPDAKSVQDDAATAPERINSALTAPKEILGIEPAYSDDARRAKMQGDVTLWVVIGADGRVHDSRVVRKAGLGLEENAMNVMSLWRFEPARKQGKPVTVQLNLQISFHLY